MSLPFPGMPRLVQRLGPIGALATCLCLVFVALGAIGPLITPHDPSLTDLDMSNVGPLPGHALGFDGVGRDLTSRLLAGARTSVTGPLLVVIGSSTIGSLIGIWQAWTGGWTDSVVTAIGGAVMAFPGLLLITFTAAIFGVGLLPAIIALNLLYIPIMARLVRGAAQRQMVSPYLDALRQIGMPNWRIWLFHLLPNVLPTIVALSAINLAWTTVDLASLSFLGLGVQEPAADWGLMVARGRTSVLEGYPQVALYPAALLVAMVVAFYVAGERYLEKAEHERGDV